MEMNFPDFLSANSLHSQPTTTKKYFANDVGKEHPYWRVTPGNKLNQPLRKQRPALASSKTTQTEDLF